MKAPIKILRDCDATLIPSGDEIKLIKGTLVRITQALGGDFTLYVNGNLVKISGEDADAIGEKVDDSIKKSIEIKKKYGPADILLVRHVVEHAYNIYKFIDKFPWSMWSGDPIWHSNVNDYKTFNYKRNCNIEKFIL